MTIQGILPPIVTPFRTNGDVDFDAFIRNIQKWNAIPLAGYLVLGSNSETPYLNEREKLELIEHAIDATAPGRLILAGTGLESTRETISLTRQAADRGAHAVLILTPSFYGTQMNDRALIQHYTSIADAVDIPVIVYNVPKFTGLNVSPSVIKELSRHPNITGMKDSAGDIDQLRSFRAVVPAGFNLIVGSASILYPALEMGIRAGILALANCAPRQCIEIQQLYQEGKDDAARELQSRLVPVNKAVTDTFGVAGLKYATTLMGFEGGAVRSPLQDLTEGEKAVIRSTLFEARLLDQVQGVPSRNS